MTNRHIASVGVAIVFLVLAAGSGEDNKPASKDTPPIATATAVAASATPPPPWLATVQANCARYKAAPNDIKKSAIFNENEALLKASEVHGLRGKLARLSTGHGGDTLNLKITMGDLEFGTGVFSPIKKGDAIYNAAAEMTEGQCVMFSAKGLDASSLVEESQVCDTEYSAVFTSLQSCP